MRGLLPLAVLLALAGAPAAATEQPSQTFEPAIVEVAGLIHRGEVHVLVDVQPASIDGQTRDHAAHIREPG